MRVSEMVKVTTGSYATVNPFLLQRIQESKSQKKKCNCKMCGEPIENLGKIEYIDAYLSGVKGTRHVKFTCSEQRDSFLRNLINHYGWSPKSMIALYDMGPEEELVQEFHCEFIHLIED